MSTHKKQYQNVSFAELIKYSENNPNRSKSLDSIGIQTTLLPETSLDNIGLNGYTVFNLNPCGVMSLVTCIQDFNSFALCLPSVRLHQISELTTKLQEKTEELKNTSLSRKRRKIHDLIGSAFNGAQLEDKDYLNLFCGISMMQNVHFVLMKSTRETNESTQTKSEYKGDIIFSSNPANWSKNNPIWIADYRGRWVAVPSEINAREVSSLLADWLYTIEEHGWSIQYPEIDATKTELVAELSLLPSWQPNDKKLSKDILSARLARSKCIQLFSKWVLDN